MKNLESEQFVVTVLLDENAARLSTFQISEALENYITRIKGLRAGVDFFVKVVEQ